MAKFDREYEKWQENRDRVSQGGSRKSRRQIEDWSSPAMRAVMGIPEKPRTNHTMKSDDKMNGRVAKRERIKERKRAQVERATRLTQEEDYGSW